MFVCLLICILFLTYCVYQAADGSARLTHSHPDAVSGAVLQCRAVWQALQADQHVAMNTDDFIAELKKVLQHEEAAKLNTLHCVTR